MVLVQLHHAFLQQVLRGEVFVHIPLRARVESGWVTIGIVDGAGFWRQGGDLAFTKFDLLLRGH